jgi:Mn-dependent DtxR family transcriptional regulator
MTARRAASSVVAGRPNPCARALQQKARTMTTMMKKMKMMKMTKMDDKVMDEHAETLSVTTKPLK